MKMAKVQEIMKCDIPSVPPSASIIEVAQKFRDCDTGILPVCDKGKLRGLITERDIIINIVATAGDPLLEKASSVMNKRQPTVSPDDDMVQAAKVMADNGIQVMPVAQNGKLLGLLTLDDLAQESLAVAAWVFSKTIRLQASGDRVTRYGVKTKWRLQGYAVSL